MGMLQDAQIAALSALPPSTVAPVDPRRSLVVTDQAILASFSFDEFMSTLASQSPTPITKQVLFNQWMDTNNRKPGLALGPHCDDTVDTNGSPTVNGFVIQCPRAEGNQIGASAFDPSSPDSYVAVALVNRIDLASLPTQGDDCGEYRIVFAKKSGLTVEGRLNRNLVVFEGVLPNPKHNGKDLSGCVPLAQFWAGLSNIADPAQRATQLHDFYYKGLTGFQPVVRAAAYGNASTRAKGQVRTNQFMQQNWLMRQYTLQVDSGFLKFMPMPGRNNPEGLLFNETANHAKSADFRAAFLNVVGSLKVNDVYRFNMTALSDAFSAFDSDAQSTTKTNYAKQFESSPNFSAAIQAKLSEGTASSLTPQDIVARAQAMSCAGCHQLSNGASLGGGLTWPASAGFAHTPENKTEPSPDGPTGAVRYVVSPAMNELFLPRRKQVMELFLGGSSNPGALATLPRAKAKSSGGGHGR
ncbi:hypothetical protein [Ideonella sp. BN130291]|uniref:hypothetical protein n=1 Tax=Ideonella sp. BN130291 TaxID=3112940 RepID=UPI002E25CC9E|nr:hypothetical protein [Ideonella sp. BN130291]